MPKDKTVSVTEKCAVWKSVGLSELKCSKCGYIDVHKMWHNYCPDCGRKMKK